MHRFVEMCGSYQGSPESLVEDEMRCEKDMQYMRSCYPPRAKRMLHSLYEQCDQFDYSDSCMMAEYPDRETIYRLVDEIYEESKKSGEVKQDMKETYLIAEPQMTSAQIEEQFEKELLLVMLCDEMHRRRMRCQRRNQLFCTC